MGKINIKVKEKHNLALWALTILALIFFGSWGTASAQEISKAVVIKLVNQSRTAAGVGELKENELLSKAADDKAKDMIANDYFAHNSPSGITPWYWIENSGYNYKYAGENLAMDFFSAEKQQAAWMASAKHKKNILNSNYREVGVAVRQGVISGHISTITVQMFGSPYSGAVKEGPLENNLPGKVEVEEGDYSPEVENVFPDGLIVTRNQNLFALSSSEDFSGHSPTAGSLKTQSNEPQAFMLADLKYKGDNIWDDFNAGQIRSAVSGNPEATEKLAWIIMIAVLSFSISLNAMFLAKLGHRQTLMAANIAVFLLIFTTTVIHWGA